MIKNFLRKQILLLVGQDINRIAREAYDEGCYATTRQMQARKQQEFAAMLAQNEKLREIILERAKFDIPNTIFNIPRPT